MPQNQSGKDSRFRGPQQQKWGWNPPLKSGLFPMNQEPNFGQRKACREGIGAGFSGFRKMARETDLGGERRAIPGRVARLGRNSA
jgi:hypothetical protein